MTQLILTAYDIDGYLREGLPAMRAAIYRANLSPAKDLLMAHDEVLVDEYDLYELLPTEDFRWIFTPEAAQVEALDPEGQVVGLTYPLILLYHHPDVLRMVLEGAEVPSSLPFQADFFSGLPGMSGTNGLIQAGFEEGLRAMWEIVGYISPANSQTLRDVCQQLLDNAPARTPRTRMIERLAQGLNRVIQQGYGLVVERE